MWLVFIVIVPDACQVSGLYSIHENIHAESCCCCRRQTSEHYILGAICILTLHLRSGRWLSSWRSISKVNVPRCFLVLSSRSLFSPSAILEYHQHVDSDLRGTALRWNSYDTSTSGSTRALQLLLYAAYCLQIYIFKTFWKSWFRHRLRTSDVVKLCRILIAF